MWEFRQKRSCVKIWHRVLTLLVAMLSMRSLHSASVLYSNSYYTVVASIFLVSTASCKAIFGVASVRLFQPFWLKWHALIMPHVLFLAPPFYIHLVWSPLQEVPFLPFKQLALDMVIYTLAPLSGSTRPSPLPCCSSVLMLSRHPRLSCSWWKGDNSLCFG